MENVWVIGGTSGIGAAVAHELGMSELYKVTMTDEHTTNVVNTAELARFYRREGPFDHIVYSAGVNRLSWLKDTKIIEVMMIMDINVVGFIRVVSLVAQNNMGMDKPKSVTAIVSDAATHPMRGSIAYCASKAALAMAVKCAARELAPHIRVNGVSPGVVEGTPMTNLIDEEVQMLRGWTAKEAWEYELANSPMGRRAYTREVSLVVKNVLEGPQYLSGAIIEVNGAR